MGLHGKLIAAIEFKAGGDLFHEIYMQKPNQVSIASPDKVQGCDLLEGQFGQVGAIIYWTYTHDGKEETAKEVIQSIDKEKKMIKFKVLEGDVMELYKDFVITLHVEDKGDIELVTWTLEYEMLNEEVGHPITILSYLIDVAKDIETHLMSNP
ncbi:kirola-like [Salvia miltiorrhiza]|uniref:kirola-like n=1 Tax=Salvia miltiorrhiza TaxID=226208 RepID=UPI0025AD8C57|nr:kirola-like [Salvia miltiorrhiza]